VLISSDVDMPQDEYDAFIQRSGRTQEFARHQGRAERTFA
jgi:hypothetical protein